METEKLYLIRCAHCRAKNRIQMDKINSKPVCGKCRHPLNLSGVFNNRPVEVTDSTFEKEVMQSPIPVLTLFWAPWCTACQSVLPVVNRIASGLSGRIRIAKINMDRNPATASRFHVMSVPMMIVFDNGKEKENMMGALSELDILKKLAPYY